MILSQRSTRRARSLRISPVWCLVALVLVGSALSAAAQSGRRAPGEAKRGGGAAPAATSEPSAESESQPKAKTPKSEVPPALTFVVCEFDNPFLNVAYISPSSIVEAFARRLGESKEVSVVRGPKISRQDARARARNEREAYVVLVVLEEEAEQDGRGTIVGEVNPRALAMRYYVYAPQTADLKFQDRVLQRPYRQTATVGGVRIPVPTPRTAIPGQREIEQLARDAANRLMARFSVRPPAEN